VREFQRNSGARVDGIVGLDTVRSLQGMRPAQDAPGRAMVREGEAARLARTLAGSLIAIDPAHGGSQRGLEANGIVESEFVATVAAALADEISARGGRAVVLRRPDEDLEVGDRARRANAADATVCVSLHLGGGSLAERGAVSCYFGSPRTHSPIGRHLAESLHGALLELGIPDGGIQPLTISILRDTRMPAAQLELGVITNRDEAAAFADPSFPARVASAITDGLERFLEGARSTADLATR